MNKYIKLAIAFILALVSIFGVSRYSASPTSTFNQDTIEYLDSNHKNVLALTATAASLSAAITLLPGDTGTPIADKLADFSTYFVIIMSAVFLEKYLLIVMGNITFKLIIPIACLVYAIYLFNNQIGYQKAALKLLGLGLALYLVIPSSVVVSRMIENSYQVTIQETIDQANDTTQNIQEHKDDENALQHILSSITSSGANIKDQAGQVINNYVESFAMMFVISCLFPILILFFFMWVIKITLGIQQNPFHRHE